MANHLSIPVLRRVLQFFSKVCISQGSKTTIQYICLTQLTLLCSFMNKIILQNHKRINTIEIYMLHYTSMIQKLCTIVFFLGGHCNLAAIFEQKNGTKHLISSSHNYAQFGKQRKNLWL